MRFQVVTCVNGKYKVLDSQVDKFCTYSGRGLNPPKYEGESKCFYCTWNNFYSAKGFADRLETANKIK
jgi:hypothetical protein